MRAQSRKWPDSRHCAVLVATSEAGRKRTVLCGWLPRCKGVCDGLACWSGAVLCPACSRGHRPLALMVSADEIPFCFAGFDALDIPQVVLVPGLTGSPSFHRVLATSFARYRADR